jgi:hypothetical protein
MSALHCLSSLCFASCETTTIPKGSAMQFIPPPSSHMTRMNEPGFLCNKDRPKSFQKKPMLKEKTRRQNKFQQIQQNAFSYAALMSSSESNHFHRSMHVDTIHCGSFEQ